MKSLLEIIVKYHITNVKVDKLNCNKSDFRQSAPIRLFDSPAVTSAVVNDTKVKGLRYGSCSNYLTGFSHFSDIP